MADKQLLLENISNIHTTYMGMERIKRNLKLEDLDVVQYCRDLILDRNCRIYCHGKNWYCEINNIKLTVNASSYTIITVHQIR